MAEEVPLAPWDPVGEQFEVNGQLPSDPQRTQTYFIFVTLARNEFFGSLIAWILFYGPKEHQG